MEISIHSHRHELQCSRKFRDSWLIFRQPHYLEFIITQYDARKLYLCPSGLFCIMRRDQLTAEYQTGLFKPAWLQIAWTSPKQRWQIFYRPPTQCEKSLISSPSFLIFRDSEAGSPVLSCRLVTQWSGVNAISLGLVPPKCKMAPLARSALPLNWMALQVTQPTWLMSLCLRCQRSRWPSPGPLRLHSTLLPLMWLWRFTFQ